VKYIIDQTNLPFGIHMKNKLIVSCLLLFLFFSACAKPASIENTGVFSPSGSSSGFAADDYSSDLIPSARSVLEEQAQMTRYTVSLFVEEDYQHLHGQESVLYTNREGVPLSEVYFRLFPNNSGDYLTITRIIVDDVDLEPVLEKANTALRLELPEILEPGQSTLIELEFELTVPSDFHGNYGLFVHYDNILALDQWMPIIPVHDDQGWNVELPPTNGDLPFTDVSLFRVEVNAPQDAVIVATGVKTGSRSQDDRKVDSFVAGPNRDFYLALSPDFEVLQSKIGDTLINSYALPDAQSASEEVLLFAENALRIFSENFGLYPYAEIDLVSTPMHGASGMEYSGVVALSTDLYDLDAFYYGQPARVMLETGLAHEVAHQWFFNTVGSDQVDEPWLDEGMAQYMTNLYYRAVNGEGAAESYRFNAWEYSWLKISREEIPIGRGSADYTDKEYQPIIYGRAPLFILSLQQEMGDEKFGQFLKQFYTTYQWGIADTEGFRGVAEQVCGCDLSEVFSQWVY